ncbi:hypothetical protein [Streptomyces tsukubensis]|uniref:hypothetical protein n=1 Tax=Streptomyces tsukubensis TaxID=83656 RepID=UPI001180D116|nr:hypothetical protein [Streptomyces tsukubensis]QFR93412.1 hypothetical protein GBW32_10350 [Streptomyces tsukubensis]
MLKSKKSRYVALSTAGVVLAGAAAGAAYAVVDNVKAPHTQAAATVRANGVVQNAKNIKSARRINPGEYCVTFSDTNLRVSRSILQATANMSNRILDVTWGNDYGCGSAQNVVKVVATNHNGVKADSWFTVSVH